MLARQNAMRVAPAQPAAAKAVSSAPGSKGATGSGSSAGSDHGEPRPRDEIVQAEQQESFVSIPESELQDMRMWRVKAGNCTRAQAQDWGMLDLYPKKYSTWIETTCAFEKIQHDDYVEYGACKFCGCTLDQLVQLAAVQGIAKLLQCCDPRAHEAARARKEWKAKDNKRK